MDGIEVLQSGANSATFYLLGTDGETPVVLNRNNWKNLPQGKLRDLLMGVYENRGRFMRAGATAGFFADVFALDESLRLQTWFVGLTATTVGDIPAGSPYVFVSPNGLAESGLSLQLRVSYSASE